VKLERMRIATKLNHFALRSRLRVKAVLKPHSRSYNAFNKPMMNLCVRKMSY
jgi:hypothetical protein